MRFVSFFHKTRHHLSGREAFNRHVDWCFYIAIGVCLIILFKTGILQLTNLFTAKSQHMKQRFLRDELVFPLRGEIFDRNGVLLATSLRFQTVAMDPFRVRSVSQKRRHKAFELLQNVLGVSVSTLDHLSHMKLAMTPVRRGVDVETATRIEALIRKGLLPGIEVLTEQVREYPWGHHVRAILGVVRGTRGVLLNYRKEYPNVSHRHLRERFPWYRYASISGATPQRGIGGIEQVFDSWLAGIPDRYRCHLDRNLIRMENFTQSIQKGKRPSSVVLTIDMALQRFVAQLVQDRLAENEACLGMAVAMEAYSGEVFAAYSASFDGREMISDDSQVFTSSFEPGSVAKPIIMLYAFQLGVLTEKDRFNCNLPVKIGDKVYRDEHKYPHDLTPREILAVSSDSGMAQIVERVILDRGKHLSTDTLNYLIGCGLGKNMSIHHTAMPRSTLPSADRWTRITPSQISIGYELEASPLHLVSLYAAFANGGNIPKPILVKRIVDEHGKPVKEICQERPLRACFPRHHASRLYDYLKSVVSSPQGTGRRAAIEGVDDIAGKTGTARRLVHGKYSRTSHNATFIGILPIEEDLIMVIGVCFQDIKRGNDYGGAACAPVFREIAEYIIERGAS